MKSIFLVLTISLLMLGCSENKQPVSESPADIPEKDPIVIMDPLSGTNLVDNIKLFDLEGSAIDLKQFTGKKIFLNFWATWCKPCILEMPNIEHAQELLSDDNYVFLLASDEAVGRINRFKATHEFELDLVRVETPFLDIGILSLPTTIIIDQEGKIAYNHVGAQEWDSPQLIEKLRNLNHTPSE